MPLDYGVPGRRKTLRGLWWGAPLGAAVVAAILAANWRYHRSVEREQGWVAAAPACPTISAAAYAARGFRARERTTDYDGAILARQFGHVICKDVDTAGRWGLVTHPVCQFTSATAIRVSRGRTEAFFEPGPGHVATVSLGSNRVTCALSGRFTLFADPTT
jgi:hypothetical protein